MDEPGMDWGTRSAPSLEDFDKMAADAWARLPEAFREMCEGLVIKVEDFATNEVLDALQIESPFDLLGLYHGISLNHKSVADVARQPDFVMLYRRPILDYWADHEETLGEIVTHVLVHEIGHHFGFSDDDMDRIEGEAVP